ncbi:MAG: peptidase M23, partial [Betaproteobacteria bacterium]
MATLGAAACALACNSASTCAEPSEQLKELRGRIERLQKQLVETEESRTEAADALRTSERAISEANRRLFNLTGQSRDAHTALSRLQIQKARIAQTTQNQQALLAKLLYQQYVAGQSEPVRLILNQQDPNETARQMFYLSYVTRARSELIAALRSDLESLDRVALETQDKSKEIARLRAEEAEQKQDMEREKVARAEILQRVSTQVAHQRQAISTLQRNEERLARLVERLARELAKVPTRTSRLRNEAVPETANDTTSAFKDLKGRLKLPVIGELANRYGSQRQD